MNAFAQPMQATGAGRIALREPGLAVIDDVLPPAQFEALATALPACEFRSVHSERHDRAWRPWDGTPLRGGSLYHDPRGAFGWRGPHHPTGTAFDPLVERVLHAAHVCADVVGTEGIDWLGVYLSAWLYPVGSCLSLHRDGDAYSGAFAFFAHRRWRAHWGGELIVQPASARDPAAAGWLDDTDDPDDPGIALCVQPKPNRLVLLGPDRPHRIARVDANAGTHVRASVAGFFLRPPA